MTEIPSSSITPTPLRLLVAWPESLTRDLQHALLPLVQARKVSLTICKLEHLDTQLQQTGYFHVLVISPAEFGKLTSSQCRRFGGRVNLLILAPTGLSRAQALDWLASASAGIAFSSDLDIETVISFLSHLCAALVSPKPFAEAMNHAWQKASSQSEALLCYLSRSDGAIWPTAAPPARPTTSPSTSIATQASVVPSSPAVVIGRAVIETFNQVQGNLVNVNAVADHTTTDDVIVPLPEPAPDLTIIFDRVSVSDGKRYYRYRLSSLSCELNPGSAQFHTAEANTTPQGFLNEMFFQLNRVLSDTSLSEARFFERLNSIGNYLYNRLFPDDLKRLYWDRLRDKVKSIVIISDESWIPWEVVRPFHPDTKQNEDGFLCEKFNLARWLVGDIPPNVIDLTRLGLIVAASDLESTRSEAAEITQLFGNKAEDIHPSIEAVYSVLKAGGYSGLHFACHGDYNRNDPDWSRVFLAAEAPLHPVDIDGDKLTFGNNRPLVFLNACETGQSGYALTGMGGWAEAFIRRAKCSAFVGPTWEANDESAYKFAVAFYRNLLDGESISEAVKLARLSIRRAGDPTWLSYAVYANPLAQLSIETAT